MLNLANKITLARICIIPLIIIMMYFPGRGLCALTMLLFLLASLSDLLDGFVARRFNQVSSFGKFLDPVADKLLICSVLVMLVQLNWIPAWAAIVVVGREILVTCLRAMAAEKGIVIAADAYGKAKTLLQVVALCPLILHYEWFGLNPQPAGIIILYLAVLMTIFSGGNYLYNFYRKLLYEKNAAGREQEKSL